MNSSKKLILLIFFSFISLCSFSQKFGIIFDGGTSYRLFVVNDSLTSDLESYTRNKKQGYNFGIEPVWYSEGNGIGIKYNVFFSKTAGDTIKVSPLERKSISEEIKLHYIGLQFHKILPIALSRFSINGSVGLGMLFYRNQKTEYKSIHTQIAGRTYALNASLVFEYRIIESLHIFAGAGFFIANINEVLENNLTVIYNPRESLTRLDLNCGLRMNIF